MAQEAREITALPLMQSGRLAMRDGQEEKALEIENKRRVAKGLEPLRASMVMRTTLPRNKTRKNLREMRRKRTRRQSRMLTYC